MDATEPGNDAAPAVAVVVPVYRNADSVAPLARRLHAALDAAGLEHEIVLVEDACPAGSATAVDRLARRDARVRALHLRRNVGQHAAVMIGLASLRSGVAVVMDADLQDPPEAVPALVARLGDGAGAVFAGRRGAYESAGRLLTSRLFKRALALAAGVPRDAGLFVALGREAVERLLALHTPRPFVPAMIGCAGVACASLPVERAPRPVGRSAYSGPERLRSALRAFGCVLDCRRPARRAALWSDLPAIVHEPRAG